MFLYRFFEKVAADADLPYYSVNHVESDEHQVVPEIDHSFCVCPVREFNADRFSEFQNLDQVTQICQVRDPRDMIVSEYFSFGWIHPDQNWSEEDKSWRLEVRKMSVDEYVINQPQFSSNPLEAKFQTLLDDQFASSELLVVKYETMVTQFSAWVGQVLPPFGFRWPRLQRARYAWQYRKEFDTSGEQMTHKRRITPGDYLEKLKPETIEILNQRYRSILDRFGYLNS